MLPTFPNARVRRKTTDRNATAAQEMVEVEIREAPRPFPVLPQFALGPDSSILAATAQGGNGTLDAAAAAAGVNGGAASANVGSFPDSASLSPDALFRAYLERERGVGGRNVSEEVRLWLDVSGLL